MTNVSFHLTLNTFYTSLIFKSIRDKIVVGCNKTRANQTLPLLKVMHFNSYIIWGYIDSNLSFVISHYLRYDDYNLKEKEVGVRNINIESNYRGSSRKAPGGGGAFSLLASADKTEKKPHP